MKTGTELLDEWIEWARNKTITNMWLHASDMEVYVRKSTRWKELWLDIANIEVREKGRGTFTKFLEHALAVVPWAGVFVENIQNPRLFIHLIEKAGFTSIGGVPPSAYKRRTE